MGEAHWGTKGLRLDYVCMCLGDRCTVTDHYPSAATVLEEGQHSGQGSVETLYIINEWVERQ